MNKLVTYTPTKLNMYIPNIARTSNTEESTETTESTPTSTSSTPISSNIPERLNNFRRTIYSVTENTSQDKPISGNITGSQEYEKAWDEYLQENPEAVEWKDFLTKIANRESGFRNVQNTSNAPAYGYFQLWHTNLQGYTPEQVISDPKLQIKLAIDLAKRNLSTFTPEDFETAQKKGFTKNALLWGSWIGGPGGVKNYLYSNIDADDSKYYGGKGGSSVGTYMRIGNYKDGGSIKDVNLIKVGNKEYYIEVVESEEDKSIGLSNKDNLPENEGMLFVINDKDKDENGLVWFTMEDTKFPLDIIFINEDLEVVQVSKGFPMSKNPIYGSGDYVLEVNSDSGIKVGDDINFISEKEVNKKMMVLDSDGNPQMILDGGERIMSIKNTKTLIKFAKKASATNKDSDYKALGKRIFKFLETQDNNPAEYV